MNLEVVEPQLFGNVVINICQADKNASSKVTVGLTTRYGNSWQIR